MSKLEEKIYVLDRKLITDSRGWFLKAIDGNEPLNAFKGEVYLTLAKPGESKGGHYHNIANEWFTLIKGSAKAILIDIITLEQQTIILNSKNPVTLFVPPKIAHTFVNTDDKEDFILVAFTDIQYNPEDTIKF